MADGRDELIKQLRDDPNYRAALGRARNAAERKAVSAMVEGFVGNVGEILGPAMEQAKNDPEFNAKLARALKEHYSVLNNGSQPKSGSNV
jgi:hypothetical protein